MLQLVFLALFVTNVYCEQTKIVNGTDAEEGEFPFVVSLRLKDRHTCGATILNENYVLTAAHCVCKDSLNLSWDGFKIISSPNDASLYSIQYGRNEITPEPVNKIKIKNIYCAQFDSDKLISDAAVLELEEKLPTDGSWQPVKLSKNFSTTKEQRGVVVGWGRIKHNGPLSKNLQKLDVIVYNDTVCEKKFDSKHHICFGAENAGACNGDSGTCLLVNGEQVGIASFITNKCGIANKEYPNVYSRVPTYYDWIAKIANI